MGQNLAQKLSALPCLPLGSGNGSVQENLKIIVAGHRGPELWNKLIRFLCNFIRNSSKITDEVGFTKKSIFFFLKKALQHNNIVMQSTSMRNQSIIDTRNSKETRQNYIIKISHIGLFSQKSKSNLKQNLLSIQRGFTKLLNLVHPHHN